MSVELGLPDRLIGRLSPGKEIPVEVSGLEGLPPFKGRVTEVGVAASSEGRLFRVVIKVPNPDGLLRSGMTARVHVGGTPAVKPGTVCVPLSALVTLVSDGNSSANSQAQLCVFVVEGGKATKRAVKTGDIFNSSIQITEGLRAGEQTFGDLDGTVENVTGLHRTLRRFAALDDKDAELSLAVRRRIAVGNERDESRERHADRAWFHRRGATYMNACGHAGSEQAVWIGNFDHNAEQPAFAARGHTDFRDATFERRQAFQPRHLDRYFLAGREPANKPIRQSQFNRHQARIGKAQDASRK